MTAGGSVPRRASGTARHGIRRRARVLACQADDWLAQAGQWELLGTAVTGAGIVLLLLSASALDAPWWAYLEFSAYCAAGLTVRCLARKRRRR